MNLIGANRLSKSYASHLLFENVSFGIDEKSRTGLVGPNGAGKSTLLKILAGLTEPDDGQVARKRGLRLGFLQQMPNFAPNATILSAVLQNAEDAMEALPRAMTLMAHLELGRFGDEFPVDRLSGGWRKRVALARELLMEPELLFLDEPTNHLDVSGIVWLEKFLVSAPFAVLMITHDRLFLQRTVDHVLDLDPRNPHYLLDVKGDYIEYLQAKENELAALKRHERVLKNTLRREREWLARGSLARQTKQSARIQSADVLSESVDQLRAKNAPRKLDLNFGDGGVGPQRLIEAQGLEKSFGERKLFKDLDLLITPKTRLALLGDNGSGKSTLVRVLLGLDDASQGQVRRADPLTYSYFEQGRETLNTSLSVLKNICPEGDYVSFQGQYIHVRSYLDRFLFQGGKAEMQVTKLSGGEQARLRLAQLMLKPAQILILDEPTNDLDADTLEVLEEALASFSGAVILVTHDRYFMDAVANQILAFPTDDMSDRRLQKFSSYFQWEQWFTNRQNSGTIAVDTSPTPAPAAAPRIRLSYKEKFELENMESTILVLENEIAKLNSEAQANQSDHERLNELHAQLATKQNELDAKYERWALLEAKSKGLATP